MASLKQYASSKTNLANAIWLAVVVMVTSWNIPYLDKWITPEAVACVSLVLNIVMRKFTVVPLKNK